MDHPRVKCDGKWRGIVSNPIDTVIDGSSKESVLSVQWDVEDTGSVGLARRKHAYDKAYLPDGSTK